MAGKELEIIIKGKDEASQAIGGVSDSVDDLGNKSSNSGAKVGGFEKNISSMATLAGGAAVAGLAAAAAGIVAVGVVSLDAATDMQNATNMMISQLGLTEAEAQKAGDIAKSVFVDNFGGSITEAADTVGLVTRAIGDIPGVTDDTIKSISELAFAVEDAFGQDQSQTIQATTRLMDDFGLSGQEAADLITYGLQNIPADDLLETITEYGGLFDTAGFSAEQMFSILQTGAQEGVLGTDKVADAIKEMQDILNSGTPAAVAALDSMGLSYDQLSQQVAAGETTWAEQFNSIIGGLNDIEDPLARSQAQVAIFGTMGEDLGVSFTTGLSAAQVSLDDIGGTADTLNAQYNNLGATMEGMWRQVQVALIPVGDALLSLGQMAMPLVQSALTAMLPAFDWLAQLFNQMQPIFADFAERLMPTLAATGAIIADTWQNVLGPAINEFFTIIGDGQEPLSFTDMILQALTATLNAIVVAVQLFAVGFKVVSDAIAVGVDLFGQLVDIVNLVITSLQELMSVDFSLGFDIPDFLIPGSPTPFEIGLKGVKSAMSQMNSMGIALPVTQAGGGNFAMAGPSSFAPTPSMAAAGQAAAIPNLTVVMDGEPVGRLISGRQGAMAKENRGASIGGRAGL